MPSYQCGIYMNLEGVRRDRGEKGTPPCVVGSLLEHGVIRRHGTE